MRNTILTIGLLCTLQLLQGCAPVVVAGAATAGAMLAGDRRSAEVVLTDQAIKFKAHDAIYSDKELGIAVHVNVVSYNRRVLITGEAPTAEMREQIEAIVASNPDVATIHNEIAVTGNTSLESRSKDSMITAKVKGLILKNSSVDPTKIKVVTSKANVYLLGLVSKEEAEAATEVARRVEGVNRVVKVFEYVEVAEAPAIEEEIDPGVNEIDDSALMKTLDKITNIQPYKEEESQQ